MFLKDDFGHNPYFTGNSFAIKTNKAIQIMYNRSQSLFYWKLLCNIKKAEESGAVEESQSLFYWKLLCNSKRNGTRTEEEQITILILLETPLQY